MIAFLDGEHRFLSNFHPCKVEYEGLVYPSSEHAYQAAKTLDIRLRRIFTLEGMTAGQAKHLGKVLPCRPLWQSIKDGIMYDIVSTKFKDPTLRQRLLETGDEEIEEGNTWGDQYWGVCRGIGLNKLGQILMRVRAEIRNEGPDPTQ